MEAFLGGFLCKVYDDLNDNHILTPLPQEILKGAQWILLTLLSYNDFNFAIFAYIANALNAIVNWNEWNHPYETSLLILYPFLVCISFWSRSYLNVYDIIVILYILLTLLLEPIFFKEEYSTNKFYSRVYALLLSVIAIFVSPYFNISPSLIKFLYYSLGYDLFSSGFQAYLLSKSSSESSSTTSSTLFFSWI
jgi:hypothetical protein